MTDLPKDQNSFSSGLEDEEVTEEGHVEDDEDEEQGWGVEVTGGHIGQVTVTVPWNALLIDDSSIEVTNLQISLKPKPRETDGASMLESMWSSVSSSMQLAKECLEKEGTGADVNQLNAQNPIEGLEKFAQTIENILKRVKAKFLNTEIRLEYIPPNNDETEHESDADDDDNDEECNKRISNKCIPIVRIDGTQEVRVKVKEIQNISGPKVSLDLQIGAVFIFLSPRQIHLLTHFYDVYFNDAPAAHPSHHIQTAPVETEEKVLLGGGWSDPMENYPTRVDPFNSKFPPKSPVFQAKSKKKHLRF
uniref:Autophagy-related protein 2 n=1 Tax=Megaselia scalaris TaxID=36166 RepID=T1GM85_MEGSC